jgi:hypothetical protein|tara:strand:- start:356 stop:922 length:567 start_codon:yes stop_codon:yes gene_type:complete
MNNVKVKNLLGSYNYVYNNQIEKKELFNTTKIDDLWFSTRITNIFYKHNIKTVYDLLRFSELDLLRLQDLGRKSLNEIKETLGLYGVNLPNLSKKKDKYFTFIALTDDDIELLITQTCKSFINDFYNRFEIVRGNLDQITEYGCFHWVETNIEAVFVYNFFQNKNINSAMLWDLDLTSWVIFTDVEII